MFEQNLFDVDTTGVEKMGGYEVYPPGDYPAMMISASKKATRNNDGYFVEGVYTFIEGDHSGKRFTSRLNLWNSNKTAADIAKRELKSIRAALGLPDNASDLTLFVNKPMVLRLTAKPRKDDPSRVENNLIAVEPYGSAPQVANPAPAHQPPQQPVGYAQPAAQPPNWQPPAQQPTQQWQPPVQQPAQMPPPAFQPAAGAPPPWAAR